MFGSLSFFSFFQFLFMRLIPIQVDGKSTHVPYRDSKLTRLLQGEAQRRRLLHSLTAPLLNYLFFGSASCSIKTTAVAFSIHC